MNRGRPRTTNLPPRNRIAELRMAAGLTQAQLGELVGLSEPYIKKFEAVTGEMRDPTSDVCLRLGRALKVSPWQVLWPDDPLVPEVKFKAMLAEIGPERTSQLLDLVHSIKASPDRDPS